MVDIDNLITKVEEMIKEAYKQADICEHVPYDCGFYVGKAEGLEEVLGLLKENSLDENVGSNDTMINVKPCPLCGDRLYNTVGDYSILECDCGFTYNTNKDEPSATLRGKALSKVIGMPQNTPSTKDAFIKALKGMTDEDIETLTKEYNIDFRKWYEVRLDCKLLEWWAVESELKDVKERYEHNGCIVEFTPVPYEDTLLIKKY